MGAGAPVAAGIRRNDNWVFPQQPLGLPSGWRIGDLTRLPQPRPCQSMDPSHELRTCIRGGGDVQIGGVYDTYIVSKIS